MEDGEHGPQGQEGAGRNTGPSSAEPLVITADALHALLRQIADRPDTPFQMGEAEQLAFDTLKNAFTSAPILAHFVPGAPTTLETDASDFAIAGVLSQHLRDNQLPSAPSPPPAPAQARMHPIAFFSRQLQGGELNYDVHDKELLAIIDAFKIWRQYLESTNDEIQVFSDHRNLEHFATTKVLSRRQARWAEILANYNFRIYHRPGTEQVKTDAMSRRPDYAAGTKAAEAAPQVLLPRALFASLLDLTLAPGSFSIAANHLEAFPSLTDAILTKLDDDLEIRQVLQDLRLQENLERYSSVPWSLDPSGLLLFDGLIYVPNDNNIKLLVLNAHHDDPLSGHWGEDKTLEKVTRNFHFPQLRQYVRNYVSTCDVCRRSKAVRLKCHGKLLPLPVPERAFDSISMAFITQLPPTRAGNDAIFAIVDRLSKYTLFIPFCESGSTAETIANLFLQHFFAHFGLPSSIISDRGSIFTSSFWQSLMTLLRTKTKLSTAFHPQTDGQTERVNQSIEQYLRIYSNYLQDDWDELLPLCQFTYNDARHASTKTTLHFAVFGQHPRFDVSLPVANSRDHDLRARDLFADLQHYHGALRQVLLKEQERQKANYDKFVADAPRFAVGDLVWLDARNICTLRPAKKLDDKLIGPLKIRCCIGNAAYELEIPPTMNVHPVFNVTLLHPYKPNTIPDRIQRTPPPVIVNGDVEDEVDEVVDSQTYHSHLRYLVRFKGIRTPRWILAENMENTRDVVSDFHKRFPTKPAAPAARQSRRRRARPTP
ncbi:hypothetical protein JCM5296_004024 [Sporobolomyces johnsonii]